MNGYNKTELDELLARPNDRLIELMSTMDGDLMILDVAGKMGIPTHFEVVDGGY